MKNIKQILNKIGQVVWPHNTMYDRLDLLFDYFRYCDLMLGNRKLYAYFVECDYIVGQDENGYILDTQQEEALFLKEEK